MIVLAASLLALALNSAPADTGQIYDLQAELPRIFRVTEVRANGDSGYTLKMDSLPADHALAPLFNANQRYFYYLASNALTPDLAGLIRQRTWRIEDLNAAYDSLLHHDDRYNAAVTASVGRFLHGRGESVAGYDPDRPLPVLRMDDVAEVAVRFFFPDAIRPDGTIQTHICVALNAVRDLQHPRNLALEAFLYDAVFEASNPGTPLHAEFKRIEAEMNRADLSSDPTIRLTRAQGFLWARLSPSHALREAIRAAYERRRGFLPFTIADD